MPKGLHLRRILQFLLHFISYIVERIIIRIANGSRKAQLFEKKLFSGRRQAHQGKSTSSGAPLRIPSDQSEWQTFFMQEVQIGEEMLQEGRQEFDKNTCHANPF